MAAQGARRWPSAASRGRRRGPGRRSAPPRPRPASRRPAAPSGATTMWRAGSRRAGRAASRSPRRLAAASAGPHPPGRVARRAWRRRRSRRPRRRPSSLLPRGSSAASASALTAGHPVGAGDQDRRPYRGGHQDRRGDRRRPGPLRRPASPPPDAAPSSVEGKTASADAGGVGGRVARRRPGSCSWSRRPDSRALPSALRGGSRARAARSPPTSGAAPSTESRLSAAAEDRGDEEDRGEENRPPDQLQRQRNRLGAAAIGLRRLGTLGRLRRPLLRRFRGPEPPHLSASLLANSGKLQAGTGWPVGKLVD